MNRKLKLIFLASLILNIILIGLISGHTYKRFSKDPKRKIATFIDKTHLSTQEKELLFNKFQEGFTRKIASKDSMRSNHEKLYQIMIAKDFEPDLYRKYLQEISKHRHRDKNNIFKVVIKIAENLDLQDRRKFAKILRKPPPRHHR